MSASSWFHIPQPRQNPRLRLLCFPFAGGGATIFHGWPRGLPEDVEVCALALPGRSFRMREQAFDRLAPLLTALIPHVDELTDRPFALFGHSVGALVAFELAYRLEAEGMRQPERLIVSGRFAPQLQPRIQNLHDLPEVELVQALQDHYGASSALSLGEDLRALVVPAIRSDLAIAETCEHTEREPLAMAISALGGTADGLVSRAELEAWKVHTHGDFEVQLFAGGHFFLQSAEAELLEFLTQRITSEPHASRK